MNDSIVPGVVYIHVGNEIQKLCETSDIHIETLANVPVSCDLPKLTEMETSASFEMVTKISEEAFLILSGIFDLSLKLCPDNRVRHLVLHAKKKRTRKKNLHRIFRMLEKEKNYE
ncbi:MAG: hypothetical protein UGF91_09755 [Dialister invisus]|jgi:hypothetical protein|uniref:Uncharacterized protein n=1 Tax=Siphoviridae sp. ctcj91 TaxID=2826395 RepID=A0A8S5QWL7_9CAUD|nr:hypothetical protein [Dialister invisus]DAE23687.1 MAG TPA: hypothetical protein [Siphoviridae sp. ctcj91]